MTMHDINCGRVDEKLADYLEGDLAAGDRVALDQHIATCVRCTALVRDLEGIRTDASELGELVPSRDLWSGIAERIETPVVPLTVRTVATPNVARRTGGERVRLAAVAAALVAVTAGVTYTLTITRGGTADSTRIAANTPRDAVGDSSRTLDGRVMLPSADTDRVVSNDAPPPGTDARSSTSEPPKTTTVTEAPAGSSEIDRLRTLFVRNRGQMDPRTAAIIEANLKVIDEAIAQSKAALAQDPASQFLNNQLNSAIGKKLELLRTAAQLPSRT